MGPSIKAVRRSRVTVTYTPATRIYRCSVWSTTSANISHENVSVVGQGRIGFQELVERHLPVELQRQARLQPRQGVWQAV